MIRSADSGTHAFTTRDTGIRTRVLRIRSADIETLSKPQHFNLFMNPDRLCFAHRKQRERQSMRNKTLSRVASRPCLYQISVLELDIFR